MNFLPAGQPCFRSVGTLRRSLIFTRRYYVRFLQAILNPSGCQQLKIKSNFVHDDFKFRMDMLSCCSTLQNTRFQSTAQGSEEGAGTVEATPGQPGPLMAKFIQAIRVIASPLVKRTVLIGSARNMYDCCVNGMDFEEFFEACELPDTFQSWFAVIHLHIWMCLVRLKPEGKDGRYLYRKLVQMMWVDIEERMKNLGTIDSVVQRDSLRALVRQFYGLTIAYDEGLLCDDTVLATALWRNLFYDKKHTDAEQLGRLVEYVRKNIQHLENLSSEELLRRGKFEWLPFKEESKETRQFSKTEMNEESMKNS